MIVKCPKCAEELEIDAVRLNRRGICPHCQSSIIFSSGSAAKTVSSPAFGAFTRREKIWIPVAIIAFFAGLCCVVCFVNVKEFVRVQINSMPESQRRAFINSMSVEERRRFVNYASKSPRRFSYRGDVDEAIKLLKEK